MPSREVVPECFCDRDGAGTCDWTVTAQLGYRRTGDPDNVTSQVEWTLDNIPQLLAQAILQANIAAINTQGLEVYAAWMRGCFDGDTPEEMVARVREML